VEPAAELLDRSGFVEFVAFIGFVVRSPLGSWGSLATNHEIGPLLRHCSLCMLCLP